MLRFQVKGLAPWSLLVVILISMSAMSSIGPAAADDPPPAPPEDAPLGEIEGTFPDDKFPDDKFPDGLFPDLPPQYLQFRSEVAVVGGAWIPQGPGPSWNGQVENVVPDNEVVGAIHTVAAHPTNPDILYAGAVNGGIWRTDNATAGSPTWKPLTDGQTSLSIGALEFDPGDPGTLIAGIGRFSSFFGRGGSLSGLLLTADGGNNWTEITDPLLMGENISGVAVRVNLLLASANGRVGQGGLFRSTDAGTSWTAISGTNGLPVGKFFDLVGDPTDPNRFYASVKATGIFRSDDGGLTWTDISSADATLNSVFSRFENNNAEMAVAGGTSERLYVGVMINGQLQYIGFTDNPAAANPIWIAMDVPQTNEDTGDHGLNPRPKPGSQGSIHFSIAADPNDANIVYVGGDRQPHRYEGNDIGNDVNPWPNSIGAGDFSGRLFRGDTSISATGGVPSPQWEHLTHSNAIAAIPGGGTATGSSPHADSREMVFDAAGNLIEVNDGGIYRRTNPANNTGDWFSINGNLQVTEFHDIAYDSVSNIIIGGAQDTGTPEQIIPGGTTWNSVSTADGGDVAVDDTSQPGVSTRYSSHQYLAGFRARTFDANNNLIDQEFPQLAVVGGGQALVPQFVTPVELNAVDPARLLIVGDNSIYESLDRGATLTEIGPGLGPNQRRVLDSQNAIAYGGQRSGVDNPGIIYVGVDDDVLVRTTSGTNLAPSPTYPGGIVRDIVLDSADYMTAYVIDRNRVFHTNDGGATWTDITGNLTDRNLRSIVFAPGPPGSVFVGGLRGVFQMITDDPGVWHDFGTGLPEAPVFDLEFDPVDSVLVAGTLGRGAWLIAVDQPAGDSAGDSIEVLAGADQTAAVGNLIEIQASFNDSGARAAREKIVFSSFAPTSLNSELYLIDPDGSNLRQITSSSDNKSTPAWSPDGTKIAFSTFSNLLFSSRITVSNADGTNPVDLPGKAPLFDSFPSWSPDSTRISFQSFDYFSPFQPTHVYVMTAAGENATSVVFEPFQSDFDPDWSHDGNRIAFHRNLGSALIPDYELLVASPDGANLVNLTQDPDRDDMAAAWCSNSSKVAYHSSDSYLSGIPFQIYVIDADGTNKKALTNLGSNAYPTWSPDCSKIAFVSNRDGNDEIYVMNSDGSAQTRLTNNPGIDGYPDWSPSPSGGSPASYTVSINWGDETVENGLVTGNDGSGTVAGSHSYSSAGNYLVTVEVTNASTGASGSGSLTVAVSGNAATCNGLVATIVGTDGPDNLIGTGGPDVIVAGDGSDIIQGNGGDDTICAEGGDDYVLAGGGNDWVSGGPGNDFIDGGYGWDKLLAGNQGDDVILGGPGEDLILGGLGNDVLIGGIHRDRLFGGDGNDTMDGGPGPDEIVGNSGDDAIAGRKGADQIDCGTGNDTADGGPDDDTATADCESVSNVP